MTDLVLRLPVYASLSHGGMIWRRLEPERHPFHGVDFHTFDAGDLPIAGVVRASAAVPGIPPRRLRIPDDPSVLHVAEHPKVAYLADGGLWNNLGSQVLREDGFIGSTAAWDGRVLRPNPAPYMPLLCFNGSGQLKPTKPWAFGIPGFALFKSLMQVHPILYANTVLPRTAAIEQAFRRRSWSEAKARAGRDDPLDLIVDLGPTSDIGSTYAAGALRPEHIRETDPEVTKWERSVAGRVRIARAFRSRFP